MTFAKLDSRILDSSLWDQPDHVVRVWIMILAKKDENGFVIGTMRSLRAAANLTDDDDGSKFIQAMEILESPDDNSKTKAFEGRRIEKMDGGWLVLNSDEYRLPENTQKEKTRIRVQKYREKNKNGSNQSKNDDVTLHDVTVTPESVTSVSVSVSDSVSSIKKEVKKKDTETPLWKQKSPEGYKAYIAMAEPEFDRLMADYGWIAEQKRYYRSIRMCVIQSLEKMWFQYWGTEEGWNHCRKKRKGETINWKRTIQNNLSMRCNQVSFKFDEPDWEAERCKKAGFEV